jgi:tetratricopeptide (TPR) repeat protein
VDYTTTCFVIMPFGTKPVGDRDVDFDYIFDSIFAPAVQSTRLPEGGSLIPRRTDRDFWSGDISQDMFEYIEYSRFALADISGLNANVLYELGVRHRAHESGTAIFRQTDGGKRPFDLDHIKTFPYEYQPETQVPESRKFVTHVLQESLEKNRLDSPVQLALRAQRAQPGVLDQLLREAENAIRAGDRAIAIQNYRAALQIDTRNSLSHMKLGLLLKDRGEWSEALAEFSAAINWNPLYAEAHREFGIAQHKLHWPELVDGVVPGEAALRTAIKLNASDFDALSSLAGIFKRTDRKDAALKLYIRATDISRGHPYPLLNELTLQAVAGDLEWSERQRHYLIRAERALRPQVESEPPYNAPWCFFDLAQICLLRKDEDNFRDLVARGIDHCTAAWQAEAFKCTLEALVDAGVTLPGLVEAVCRLTDALATFPTGRDTPLPDVLQSLLDA